jgi:hypothetical protein
MWEQIGDKKLQLAGLPLKRFFCPGKFRNVALSLAGDELTQPEGVVIFEVVGKEMPIAPCLVGSAFKSL